VAERVVETVNVESVTERTVAAMVESEKQPATSIPRGGVVSEEPSVAMSAAVAEATENQEVEM
jgi:hypothetical protein